jgi:hypothetical protein
MTWRWPAQIALSCAYELFQGMDLIEFLKSL